MIYYFNSAKFKFDHIKHMDLNNKTLVYIDSNTVQECSTQGAGLEFLPQKLRSHLEKLLEKTVGAYNTEYMNKKRNMDPLLFESILDREEDTIPFDYWKIREGFFEFLNELVGDYQKYLFESKMLGGIALGSKDLFDFQKYYKSKSSLKPKEFIEDFSGTNMFSRFLECRVLPETVQQEVYYNYFDKISKLKADSPKQELLSSYIQQVEAKASECLQPDSSGLPSEVVWCYQSAFPEWSFEVASVGKIQSQTQTTGMSIDENYEFLVQSFTTKASDDKWARANLEMLHTVWFVALQIFLQNQAVPISVHLVNFAYNKFLELEAEKINWNVQIVKSLAFCLGVFREVFKFQRVIKKAHKVLEEHNQQMAVYAEYVKGLQVKPSEIDPKIKVLKFVKETSKELIVPKLMDSSVEVKDADEDQRDELIPAAVKSYFATNAFCSQCATYIPEEIILATMNKDPKKTIAKCPNQACLFEYQPVFNCKYLKEKGCREIQSSRPLLSPLRLFILTKEFLTTNNPSALFSEHASPDLYWNILFYGNLLNLPCFFVQEGLNPHLVEFSMHQLNYFVFEEKYGSGGTKTTINGISNNESSFAENSHSLSMSPEKKRSNNSATSGRSGDGTLSTTSSTTAKFSFKKDL